MPPGEPARFVVPAPPEPIVAVLHVAPPVPTSAFTSVDPMTGLGDLASYALYDPELQEELEKAEKETPDLIILDVMMPEKDGYSLLHELQDEDSTKSIPVIVATAKPGMKHFFQAEGVNDFIVKPFDMEDLLPRIKKAIGE